MPTPNRLISHQAVTEYNAFCQERKAQLESGSAIPTVPPLVIGQIKPENPYRPETVIDYRFQYYEGILMDGMFDPLKACVTNLLEPFAAHSLFVACGDFDPEESKEVLGEFAYDPHLHSTENSYKAVLSNFTPLFYEGFCQMVTPQKVEFTPSFDDTLNTDFCGNPIGPWDLVLISPLTAHSTPRDIGFRYLVEAKIGI